MSIAELLAGLLAKLAGLAAASKAALGLGVVAATVTGAGAAGVLPDPAQHAVARVVKAATPFEFEDPNAVVAQGDHTEENGDLDGTDGTDDADGTDGTDGTDGEARVAAANHGACVSEVARNAPRGPGGQHGRAVSEVARSDCGKTPAGTTPDPTTTTSVPTTTTTTLDDGEVSVEANRGRGGRGAAGGNPGRGNSGNSGNANSGPGSSGNGNAGPGAGSGGGQGPGRSGK